MIAERLRPPEHTIDDLEAILARRRLIRFTERMFPGYRAADHHRLIASHLEAVERGDIDRLLITMAPRHGKSELASVQFPAWYLGRNPDNRVIATSYAAGLAYRFSRRARNVLIQPAYPFAVRPAGDLANVQAWDVADRRGGYVSAGVGGAVTGLGAHLLVIDDPVKSAEEADSEAYRDRAWEWYQQTAYTRLEDGGAVVCIGTRWHQDDLIGRLLAAQETGGDRWTVLHLPALDDDGRALWSEKYDVAALDRIRAAIGSRAWEALYQGRPSPAEGGILKRHWWRYWVPDSALWNFRSSPATEFVIQGWDTAFKKGAENDYSACVTIAVRPDGYYVLDVWRDRVEYPSLKRAVAAQYQKWRPDEVLVEDKASGQSILQEMRTDSRLPVVPFKSDKDKIARVNAITPTVESGNVVLPVGASWEGDFVEECAGFPNATHDDQVDAFAMPLGELVLRDGGVRRIDASQVGYFRDMPSVSEAGW